MATVDHQRNLGYFLGFMRNYGRSDYPTRAELYRDTQAYSAGVETAEALYSQVADLLGVTVTSPQVFVSPTTGTAA